MEWAARMKNHRRIPLSRQHARMPHKPNNTCYRLKQSGVLKVYLTLLHDLLPQGHDALAILLSDSTHPSFSADIFKTYAQHRAVGLVNVHNKAMRVRQHGRTRGQVK